jgi:hypothetical protein
MPNRKTFNERDKYDHSSHSTTNRENGDLAPAPDGEGADAPPAKDSRGSSKPDRHSTPGRTKA